VSYFVIDCSLAMRSKSINSLPSKSIGPIILEYELIDSFYRLDIFLLLEFLIEVFEGKFIEMFISIKEE
jgi:hypothetical protein